MVSPKKIKESIRVSVVLSKEQVDRIQYRVLRMSLQAGRTIGISEGVRCALEVTYPENIKISARPDKKECCKKIKNKVTLSIFISSAMQKRLQEVKNSWKNEGHNIGVSGLIRLAIEETFPIPKNQLDLFD